MTRQERLLLRKLQEARKRIAELEMLVGHGDLTADRILAGLFRRMEEEDEGRLARQDR